jgi:transposase-like protein
MKSRTKPALRVVPHTTTFQISLPMAEVLDDVRSAFVGLCFHSGRQVLAQMMELDRVAVCGAKGVPDPQRRAVRGGHTVSQIVLGGQRVRVPRPRARRVDGGEIELPTFAWAADRDPLDAATLSAIAAGVSTRKYAGMQDELPEPEVGIATSKSAVSRRFVALSQAQLKQWLRRRLDDLDVCAVMIDGIHFHERVVLVALGIDTAGDKHVLGLHEGSTEAERVVKKLLSDLVERGLDASRMRLWIIDGGKALRRAIVELFGATALIQRCQEHKRRNVLDHLPKQLHASVNRALHQAYRSDNAAVAKRQLVRLAASLEGQHPGAAASLREGLDETLTAQRLGLTGALYRTLRTTNPIENLNGLIAQYTRNVKRWKDGAMTLRWIASALSDASQRFRKLRGYSGMKPFLKALQSHAPADLETDERKAA